MTEAGRFERVIELVSLVVVSGIVLGATALLAWGQGADSFNNDDIIIYAVVAKLWGQGEVPYRDVVDHKPPLIYLFFRVCFWLGGLSPRSIWQGYIWLTGFTTVGLVVVFRRASFYLTGLAFGLFYAVFFFTDPLGLRPTAFLNTEQLASSFLAMALGCLIAHRRRRELWLVILAGLAFGAAVVTKQPAVMFGLACCAHLFTTHLGSVSWQSIKGLALNLFVFGCAAFLPLLVFILYFWSQGSLPDFALWVYLANLKYAGPEAARAPLRTYVFLEHMQDLRAHLLNKSALVYLVSSLSIPLLLVIRRAWIDIVAACWLLSALLSTALNLQGPDAHYHVFYQVPCAFACAVTLHAVSTVLPSRWGLRSISVAALLAILLYGDFATIRTRIQLVFQQSANRTDSYEGSPLRQSMAQLELHAGGNPRILFYGPNVVALFYTKLLPASKYIYSVPVIEETQRIAQMLEAFRRYDPAVALVGNYSPDGQLGQYVQAHYDLLGPGAQGMNFVKKR